MAMYESADPYNGGACAMQSPVAIPTVVPTATPTPLPSCVVQVLVGRTVYFRIQPFLDSSAPDPNGENFLFQLVGTANGTALILPDPALASLWSAVNIPAPSAPDKFIPGSVTVIAFPGVISWISPNVSWAQVEMNAVVNDLQVTLRGYIEVTDSAGNPNTTIGLPCSVLGNPLSDPQVIQVPTGSYNAPNQLRLFGDGLNIAVMGVCRFHNGAAGGGCSHEPDQSNPLFTTLDLIPANLEFCLDSVLSVNLSRCNPPDGVRVPVYSPVDGCAIYRPGGLNPNEDATMEIDFIPQSPLNCNSAAVTDRSPRLQIVVTHLIAASGFTQNARTTVQAGQLVGYLCTSSDWISSVRPCGSTIDQSAPPHLAVLLRDRRANTNAPRQAVLGFLTRPSPNCILDRWINIPGSFTVQTNRDLEACS